MDSHQGGLTGEPANQVSLLETNTLRSRFPDSSAPGPDGYRAGAGNPRYEFHLGLHAFLEEAKAANDPHHCGVERLATGQAWLQWSVAPDLPEGVLASDVPALVHSVLERAFRIESLGPRALDEGGVRGWNSIGWLDNLLRRILERTASGDPVIETPPDATASSSLDTLVEWLAGQSDHLEISLASRLPDLLEWIERWSARSSHPNVVSHSPASIKVLAKRFETPSSRSIWKRSQLRRIRESLQRLETPTLHALAPLTEEAPSRKALPSAPSSGKVLLRDERFRGRRVLQRPLALHLRSAGWRFPLQGAWDPPAQPSCIDRAAGLRAELKLKDRDPSDLNPGGSCRWVVLDVLEVSLASPAEEAAVEEGAEIAGSTVARREDIQRLRDTWIRLIEDGCQGDSGEAPGSG